MKGKMYLKRAVIPMFFLLVIIIVYWPTITSNYLFVKGDGIGYYISKIFLVNSIKDGEFPFWNPFVSIGTPFLADVQQTALSPFNFLFFLVDPALAFNVFRVLQLFLAGYFMYLFMYEMVEDYLVCMITGFLHSFSIMLGGSRVEHTTILTTLSFFSVILYFLEKYRKSQRSSWMIASVLAMGVQFVSGFTQIVFYFDIVLFCYMIVILKEQKNSLKEIFKTSAIWILLYILIIAIQLVPLITLMIQSGRVKIAWESFSVLSYDLRILLMMLFPTVFENQNVPFGEYASSGIDIEIYIGCICLIYLIYEILYHFKQGRTRILTLLMVGSFLYGMVPHIPVVGKLIYNVPILGSFRVCGRSLLIFVFFALCLAGMGLSHIYDENEIGKIAKINLYVIGFVAVSFVITFCIFSQQTYGADLEPYTEKVIKTISVSGILCTVNYLILIVGIKKMRLFHISLVLLGVISLLDVVRFSATYELKRETTENIVQNEESENIKSLVNDATDDYYRSFAAIALPEDIAQSDVLSFATYQRSIWSEDYLYNSYLTFLDQKLKYWNMNETAYYPNLLSFLRTDTSLASMMGIRYIMIASDQDIDPRTVDDSQPKKIVFEDNNISMEKGEGYVIFASEATWMEEKTSYLITIESDRELLEGAYTDFYSDSYVDSGLTGRWNRTGANQYQTLINVQDLADDSMYFRIVIPMEEECNLKNVTVERVETKPLLTKIFNQEECVQIYENEDANQLMYIPDHVVGISGYGSNWREDNLVEVNKRSYIEEYEGVLDLTEAYSEIREITMERNSATAKIYSDNKTFLNFSQLYYPGWNVYIDGEKSKLYAVNNLIQGVFVPEGEHTIKFEYEPVDFYVGAVLTGIGLAVCIVIIIKDMRNTKRKWSTV